MIKPWPLEWVSLPVLKGRGNPREAVAHVALAVITTTYLPYLCKVPMVCTGTVPYLPCLYGVYALTSKVLQVRGRW
jgi:hypothetical protein